MKTKLFIGIAVTIITANSYAQQLKPNAIVKSKSASFETKLICIPQIVRLATLSVFIMFKNSYFNKIPKNRHPDITVERSDKGGMLRAFTEVFSDERLKQLIPERYIQITLNVDPSGQILDMSFILNRNTLITALELEDLEKAIKNNVRFRFRPEEIKGQDFVDVNYLANYQQILNRKIR